MPNLPIHTAGHVYSHCIWMQLLLFIIPVSNRAGNNRFAGQIDSNCFGRANQTQAYLDST